MPVLLLLHINGLLPHCGYDEILVEWTANQTSFVPQPHGSSTGSALHFVSGRSWCPPRTGRGEVERPQATWPPADCALIRVRLRMIRIPPFPMARSIAGLAALVIAHIASSNRSAFRGSTSSYLRDNQDTRRSSHSELRCRTWRPWRNGTTSQSRRRANLERSRGRATAANVRSRRNR